MYLPTLNQRYPKVKKIPTRVFREHSTGPSEWRPRTDAEAELVALDTMNLWIENTRESLIRTIKGVDVVIINDAEARQLTGIPELIKAARKILVGDQEP